MGTRKQYDLRSSPVVCDEVHQLRTPRVYCHVVGKGNASGTPLTETGYSEAVRSCLIFSHLSAACAQPRAGAELQVSKRSCVCARAEEGLAGFRQHDRNSPVIWGARFANPPSHPPSTAANKMKNLGDWLRLEPRVSLGQGYHREITPTSKPSY